RLEEPGGTWSGGDVAGTAAGDPGVGDAGGAAGRRHDGLTAAREDADRLLTVAAFDSLNWRRGLVRFERIQEPAAAGRRGEGEGIGQVALGKLGEHRVGLGAVEIDADELGDRAEGD